MDVHDSPTLSRRRPLEPSMVVTNEPGLYVPHRSPVSEVIHPDFLGVGVRIEDDVMITEDGPEVMTRFCPVEPDELQRLVTMRPEAS
jgi:Xaa-Pro aminopeptidase